MDDVQELQGDSAAAPAISRVRVQSRAWLLELSLDWIVLRASENIHHLLGKSHVTLIDEPLGRFVHAQALHDLRNLFSRLSGTTGIARAYRVRLTDEPELVDIAFQLADGRVLFEAVPSAGTFGEWFGSVGGLINGLADNRGQALLDGAARRMRALTGYDRVVLTCGERRAESSRRVSQGTVDAADLPVLLADSMDEGVAIFPREAEETSAAALLRSPDESQRHRLSSAGIGAMLRRSCSGCERTNRPSGSSIKVTCDSPRRWWMFSDARSTIQSSDSSRR